MVPSLWVATLSKSSHIKYPAYQIFTTPNGGKLRLRSELCTGVCRLVHFSTCVVFLFVPDAEHGLHSAVGLAHSVAAAHMSAFKQV